MDEAEKKFVIEVNVPGFITFRNVKNGGLVDTLKFNPRSPEGIDVSVDQIVSIVNELSVRNGFLNIFLSSGSRVYIPASTGVQIEQLWSAMKIARELQSGIGSAAPLPAPSVAPAPSVQGGAAPSVSASARGVPGAESVGPGQ